MRLAVALVLALSLRCLPASAEEAAQRDPKGAVVVASVDYVSDEECTVTPLFVWRAGRYLPLPTGIERPMLDIPRGDFLPSGEVDPQSPRVTAARAASILNDVRSFDVFRQGKRVGTFDVREVVVGWRTGSTLSVIGRGVAKGFTPTGSEMAVAGPARHEPFWTSRVVPEAAKVEAERRMTALLPAAWPSDVEGATAGTKIAYEACRAETTAVDLDARGEPEVFGTTTCTARWPPDGGTSAYAFTVVLHDGESGGWRSDLSSVYLGEGQVLYGGPHFSLMDALDVDGDGRAEVVVSRSHGSASSDVLVLGFDGRKLRPVLEMRGLWGS